MKRSREIVLVLSGALISGALSGCKPSRKVLAEVSESGMYTNNHFVSGVGYYHAPYHAWFAYPYNHFDPTRGYYYGGNWRAIPEQDTVTESRPTSSAVHAANAHAASSKSSLVTRGGFGESAHAAGS